MSDLLTQGKSYFATITWLNPDSTQFTGTVPGVVVTSTDETNAAGGISLTGQFLTVDIIASGINATITGVYTNPDGSTITITKEASDVTVAPPGPPQLLSATVGAWQAGTPPDAAT